MIFTCSAGGSCARFFSISSCLRNFTWLAMSGRLVANMPDSPQQRSLNTTSLPSSSPASLVGFMVFIGVWQGS